MAYVSEIVPSPHFFMEIVRFPSPEPDPASSIPLGLRNLADAIERGEKSADNLVWIATGDDGMAIGILGASWSIAGAHLMVALALRAIEEEV